MTEVPLRQERFKVATGQDRTGFLLYRRRPKFPNSTALVAIGCCAVCLGRIEGQTNAPDACQSIGANSGSSLMTASVLEPRFKPFLGIFPSHNVSPCLSPYVPISSRNKFAIASADAFGPGAVMLAALKGGTAQLLNSNRSFGQEASGYGRYAGAAYANHVLGDFLTEGVYPSLLHQDPRYFRIGSGSTGARVLYALSRVFWTQTDAGVTAFNYSRVLGASSNVAISSLYYAKHRDAERSAVAVGAQLGCAMATNVFREFWPDLSRRFFERASKPGGNPARPADGN